MKAEAIYLWSLWLKYIYFWLRFFMPVDPMKYEGQGQTTWTWPLYLRFLHHTLVRGCLSNHSFRNTLCSQQWRSTSKYAESQCKIKSTSFNASLLLSSDFFLPAQHISHWDMGRGWAIWNWDVGGKALYFFLCLVLIDWGGTESWTHLPLHLISFEIGVSALLAELNGTGPLTKGPCAKENFDYAGRQPWHNRWVLWLSHISACFSCKRSSLKLPFAIRRIFFLYMYLQVNLKLCWIGNRTACWEEKLDGLPWSSGNFCVLLLFFMR